jgi:hypothetical protein
LKTTFLGCRSIRLISLFLVGLVVDCSASGLAQTAESLGSRQSWTAQWISHPTAPLREPAVLHFKKVVEVGAVPGHFVVHVSADNRFVFYVNGQRVGDGPARGDLSHWRYETFDLAPMMKAGKNVVAATVWNFGIYAPVAQMSERTGFLVQGDGAAEAAVNTDTSWLVEEEPGQIPLARTAGNFWDYVAVGWGESLRAGSYDWNWMAEPAEDVAAGATVAHGGWVHAGKALREMIYPGAGVAAAHGVTADVQWALEKDTLPHMAYRKEDAGHVVRVTPTDAALKDVDTFPAHPLAVPAKSHVHILLDRSELTTAYPKLRFSGGNGSHVVMTYAEALFDEKMHKGNRNDVGNRRAVGLFDEVYPDGGKNRVFESLWWRTWRYVDIDIETADDPLTLDGMEASFTGYPFDVKAKFASSDPDLEKIWSIGWHTAQLDAHETYMDCPYYEQLQYAGDTRVQAMITYAMTGDDRLPRQALRALNDSRIPEGITASRYPSQLPQYIPTFSLLWIGMLHDNYMYRPDTDFVKEILPGTRTVLDWFASYQHKDGLLGKLPWWSFVDWVENQKEFPSYDANGESCLTTLQYVGALEDAIDLESHLGAAEYVEMDRRRLALAKGGVISQCWDAKTHLVADSPSKTIFSQHANMLAVLHDVVPIKEQAGIMRTVLGKEIGVTAPAGTPELVHASYYFRYYLARALDHVGMSDDYLKLLGSWRGFLTMGFTTWPETPGDTRSDAHAWTSHPTYDLLTLVAGIGPAEPGFKTVRIAPHLGDLGELEVTYPHDKGLVHVKYSGGQGTVELPAGLDGVFVWTGKETKLHGGVNTVGMR